jgi:hypothetical protein
MEKVSGRFTLIYFVLLVAGLAISALGYRFNIWGFVSAGVIWILVTPSAVKSTVPYQIRMGSVLLLIIGGAGGVLLGLIAGEAIKPIVGLLGGFMLGGIGGWAFYGLIFDSVLHFMFDSLLPKVSTIILIIIFTLGGLWGAISLSPMIPKYFESVGGGMLVGGIIGAFSGILLGAEIIKRQTEW